MTAADPYREYLAGTTLTAAAASFTLNIAPRAILWVELAVPSIGVADIPAIQFNSDSGANYVSRYFSVAAASTTVTNTQTSSTTMGRLSSNTNAKSQAYMITVSNPLALCKAAVVNVFQGTGAVATTGAIVFGGFNWINTTAQISSLKFLTVSSNTFGIGTMARVFGGDFL